MKTTSRLLPIVIAIVVLAAIAAALMKYLPSEPAPVAPLPVAVGRLKTPHSGLWLIAEAKGFLAEEGLNATVKTTLTGYEAINQVLRGELDIGSAAETPVARTLAEGKEIDVIATIFTSQWNSAVVARKDRGIAAPADLKGKRIGFVFGTATHYMLETFLAFHGIPLESVTMIPLKADEIVAAAVSGDVDAASTWTPYLTEVQQKLGDNGLTFTPKEFYSETFNIVVRPDYVREHRETVDRVLRALAKAESFAQSHPDEAVTIIASAAAMDAAALRGHGDPLTFELTLRQPVLLAVENEVRWYFRRGLVPEAPFPDVLQAFEPEPLRALKPTSVSIAN